MQETILLEDARRTLEDKTKIFGETLNKKWYRLDYETPKVGDGEGFCFCLFQKT